MLSNTKNTGKRPLDIAIISLSILLVFSASLGNDFIPTWDDDAYVLDNQFIRSFSWSNIKSIFTTGFVGNYAPLHILSYSFDYAIWGLNPFGYHFTNVILHIFSAVTLYYLIILIHNERFIALLVGLVFAVHPVNVENVAWISERKSIIAILFFLLSFYMYISSQSSNNNKRYLYSILFYGLSLMAKVSTAPFPLILIAYDYFLHSPKKIQLINKLPYLILATIFTSLTFYVHKSSGSLESNIGISFILLKILPTMSVNLVHYFKLLFLPVNLSGFYDAVIYSGYLHLQVIIALIFIITTLVFSLMDSRITAFWMIWFYLFLAPVMNIVPLKVFMADRFLYIPSIGIFVIVLSYILKIYKSFKTSQTIRLTIASLLFVIIFTLSVLSIQRNMVWKDDLTFWTDTAKKSPGQYVPHLSLGVALETRHRYDEARKEYEKALKIYPYGEEAIHNLKMIRATKQLSPDKSQSILKK